MAAVWELDELDELDARRRRNRMPTLKQGALLIARRVAGRCFDCNTRLRRSTRRSRTDYCQRHNVPEALQRSREYAIRETLDAASGQRRTRQTEAARLKPDRARPAINRKRVAVRAPWRIDTVATSGDAARFRIKRLQAHAATSGS
jgi:hypothetical protein